MTAELGSLPTRRDLRRKLRRQRRTLTREQQLHHAHAVARLVATSTLLRRAHRIAAYLATDGELDPLPLIKRLLALRKLVALPVVHANRGMKFRRYKEHMPLVTNRFSIAEPSRESPIVHPGTLDVVFAPLVAFDDRGNRLGRGGGHYDATFAKLAHVPMLIGLAHELQHVDMLPHERWDVSLDAVITEQRVYAVTVRGQRLVGSWSRL